jgi:hypothetical protein
MPDSGIDIYQSAKIKRGRFAVSRGGRAMRIPALVTWLMASWFI